jgi:hypothetical protein
MLRRSGQFLFMPAECADALAGLRTLRVITGASNNGHGYRAEPMGWELFARLGPCMEPLGLEHQGVATKLACWAGLDPVVRRLLARAGHAVSDLEPAPAALPAPDRQLLKKIAPTDEPFLDIVRRRDRALISYDPAAVRPDRLVAQIALAWPGLKIAVAVKRTDEAHLLARRLCPYLADVEYYHNDHHPSRAARVAVATIDYLTFLRIGLSERDMLIVLNAREGACPDAQYQFSGATQARLYGLLPLCEEPSPFEQDQLDRFYGFERLCVPGHGQRARTVQAVFLRATGKVALPAKVDLVARLRRAVWASPVRNRRISRLARLLAADERKPLRQQFPAVAAPLEGRPVRGVVVLVDGVEHALALAGQLPGWDVLAGLDRHLDGLSAAQKEALANNAVLFPADRPTVIATGSGIDYVNMADVDVVIRADAGVGLPPLPAAALVEPNSAPMRPLLLIDFLDHDDPVLRRRARRRQQAYADAGWFGVGVDPVEARVDAFLAAARR